MKYATINNITICVTKLAVFSKAFNTIKVYDKPIVVEVENMNKISGNLEITAKLPAHKDDIPIVIPPKYLVDIKDVSIYGNNFKYQDYSTNFTVHRIEYDGGELYTLVDRYNVVTYHTKPELFKTLKNNMLQNLSILDEL